MNRSDYLVGDPQKISLVHNTWKSMAEERSDPSSEQTELLSGRSTVGQSVSRGSAEQVDEEQLSAVEIDKYVEEQKQELAWLEASVELIESTAERLQAYLVELTTTGGARELDERVASYCRRERLTNESMARVLSDEQRERAERHGPKPVGSFSRKPTAALEGLCPGASGEDQCPAV